MKRILLFVISLVIYSNIWSQDLNISQYAFFRDGFNPSSFLQSNDMNVFLLLNKEFFEFAKQPTTQLVDLSFKFSDKKIGLTLYNDKIGFDLAQNVRMRYGQLFKLSENSTFSLGLGAGVMHNYLNAQQMSFEFPEDPLKYLDYKYTRVDFDFGTEFQLRNLTLGFSALHIGKQIKDFNLYNDSPAPHYYAYGEYAIKVNQSIVVFPNVLFRQWKNTFWGEASVVAFYKRAVWAGLTYTRHNDLTVNTGLRIMKNLMFGYAFKANMDPKLLKPISNDSHEIFLNYAVKWKEGGLKTPRFID